MKNSPLIGKMQKVVGAVVLGCLMGGAVHAMNAVGNLDFGATTPVYTYQGALVTADANPYWNNGGAADTTAFTLNSATFNNLTASDGTTITPWDVSLTYDQGIAPGYWTAPNALLDDWVTSYFGIGGHLTISGLTPNSSYQVYLYQGDFPLAARQLGAGGGTIFTMGADNLFAGGTTIPLAPRTSATVPTTITGTSPNYSPLTDYAVFNVISDGGGNLYGHWEGPIYYEQGFLAGLQIFGEIPEPSTALLLGLGGVLLLRRRRTS